MSTIATLVVKLIADASSYKKDMEGAQKTANDVSKTLTNVGGAMTAGVTLPLVGIGIAAINMASDVGESTSKINVLFGEMGTQVIAWSGTTAESMGIAKADALDYAGELGNVLIAQGLAGSEAANMSMDMVQLAADMASFNNASPEETFRAIQAGAIGSSEPLRKYGVVLLEATVQQKALEMTGKATKAELTEQDKTLARLALITEQTTAAQGDFTRTSDGLANSTRITTAQFKDAGAELGEKLLPIGLKVINMVSDAITWFDGLSESNKNLILIVGGVVAAIGPLLLIVGQAISIFTAIIPVITAVAGVLTFPLIAIIAAVIAIIALLYLAWTNNWGGIRDNVQAIVKAIQLIIKAFIALFQGDWEGFTSAIGEAWQVIWDQAVERFEAAKATFLSVADAIKGGITGAIQSVISWIQKMIDKLSNIKLPKWLTPGSPTPFELGLRGISGALADLTPKLSGAFSTSNLAPQPMQIYLQGNYAYESEESIVDRLKMFEMMRS